MSPSAPSTLPQAIDAQSAGQSISDLVPPPLCRVCHGRVPLRSDQPGRLTAADLEKGLRGRIPFLPQRGDVHVNSVALDSLNADAWDHPCVILDQSPCSHMVFVAQTTSFGEGIRAKIGRHPNAAERTRLYNEYVAIQHQGTTEPHNQLSVLECCFKEMPKQSYVHLDYGVWIEYSNLRAWGPRVLTPESAAALTQHYIDAVRGRRGRPSPSTVRLYPNGGAPKPLFQPPPKRNAAIAIVPPPSSTASSSKQRSVSSTA